MSNIKLSVVIPAYNEAKNVKKGVLDSVYEYLKDRPYTYEVLIVDDGSTDNTVELVKEAIKDKKGFKVVENEHGGKALTVISGMLKTQGEVAVFSDMDQATPIGEVEKLFPKFEEGYDIVIGSRSGRKGAPLIRKISAWGFSVLRNVILGLPFADTQCGFKAFNRQAIDAVFPRLLKIWQANQVKGAAVNAGFDIEMLYLAKSQGLKIADCAVQWEYVGSERVHVVKDAIEAIKDMLRIRLNAVKGKYV